MKGQRYAHIKTIKTKSVEKLNVISEEVLQKYFKDWKKPRLKTFTSCHRDFTVKITRFLQFSHM